MFGRNCRQNMCPQQPVMEQPITNCVEENIMHQVDHIIPIHTHVIKRHIYNHTYPPKYSCSEECQVINNDCGCPKYFNR